MSSEPMVEILDLDLALMGTVVAEHDDDGGFVVFTTKELLVDLRNGVVALGEKIDAKPSREDLLALEQRMQALHDSTTLRVAALERAEVDNRVRWAKVIGAAAAIGTLGGAIGAGLVNALGLTP
jgi:hypothetical protein